MMMSQFLKSVDFVKTQNPRYLEKETLFFLQIKKFINRASQTTLWKNSFVAEVTFKINVYFLTYINMRTIPTLRFSKTNWLNFHHHHCSSLITSCFKTVIIGDSIAAGQSKYQNVWTKFLEPLKTLNCGRGDNSVLNVLWQAHDLPVITSLNVILGGKMLF